MKREKKRKYKTEPNIIEFFRWINLKKNRNEIVYNTRAKCGAYARISGIYIYVIYDKIFGLAAICLFSMLKLNLEHKQIVWRNFIFSFFSKGVPTHNYWYITFHSCNICNICIWRLKMCDDKNRTRKLSNTLYEIILFLFSSFFIRNSIQQFQIIMPYSFSFLLFTCKVLIIRPCPCCAPYNSNFIHVVYNPPAL